MKLRIGYDDDYGRLRDFCGALEESGADYIVLHPRLKSEKLRRSGHWDYVRRLGTDLRIPVLGNGDVRSFETWEERTSSFCPAGVMVGREAVRRPWFFALLRGRKSDPGFSPLRRYRRNREKALDLIEEHLPPEFHLSRARRFFFYFCDNLSFAHHIRWKIQNART
jgi:tRNA-dihydrouridine synthase